MARAGRESSATLLPLARAFQHETNEKVFSMAAGVLAELRKFVEDNEAGRARLKQISAEFARNTFTELGWDERDGESDDDRERRTTALGLILYGEDSAALTEAKQRFDETDLDNLPAEIRPLIINANVRHFETPEMIDRLFTIYQNTPSADLQVDIALSLTSTKDPATTERILTAIKDTDSIRPQDASRWFAYLIRTRENRHIAWNWLKDNWTWVKDTFGGDKSYDTFIRYAASALLTRSELNDFTKFTTPLRIEPALARTIDLGIREVAGRVALIERDQAAVIDALNK